MSNWYLQNGKDSDVVLNTKISLSRNIKEFKFESRCSKEEKNKILETIEKIVSSLGYNLKLLKLKDMDDITKMSLIEKNIISQDLLSNKDNNSAILINDEENICIMINEIDHIKIQVFSEGIGIEELNKLIIEIDQKLEKLVEYAYNEKYGYLTSCPIDLGTGYRISLMLHLPGLKYTGNLSKVLNILNNFGISIKGIYGESNQSIGEIYEITNKQTLGISEDEIVKNMKKIVEKIIEQERIARKYLGNNQIEFEDRVYRKFGILKNARILPSNECLDLLSIVKLGTDMGIIKELDDLKIRKMSLYTKSFNLQKYYGKIMNRNERDIKRTEIIRKIINEKI